MLKIVAASRIRITEAEIDRWTDYDIGDDLEIDGQRYKVVNKTSLHKVLDGKIHNSPARIRLR
jgi:hypothetical protein